MKFPYAPYPVAAAERHATGTPAACFGGEHGRNKGEFNSLERRQG
jgi:hypothetical protein